MSIVPRNSRERPSRTTDASSRAPARPVTITLNGDAYPVAAPLTVSELLSQLGIDARRVAVEHNLVVVKRAAYDRTTVNDGDAVEIVNFVGGG